MKQIETVHLSETKLVGLLLTLDRNFHIKNLRNLRWTASIQSMWVG